MIDFEQNNSKPVEDVKIEIMEDEGPTQEVLVPSEGSLIYI